MIIGSSNPSKIAFYKQIVPGSHSWPAIDIPEELGDQAKNSLNKARTYAKASGELALADDTGIFIPVLNNEPGVAVRRWNGHLPEKTSDEEWEAYFLKRIEKFETPIKAVKRHIITLALPDGRFEQFIWDLEGEVSGEFRAAYWSAGFPFGAYFYLSIAKRYESEMRAKDWVRFYPTLKHSIENALKRLRQL